MFRSTPSKLTFSACAATALLLLASTASLQAQSPAQDALDNADARARETGPETLNTVQQARMKLGDAKRAYARAEKYDKKALEAKGEADQKKYRDKAKGAFEDAIESYKAALQLDSKLVDAWIGLANLMVKSAHPAQAIETYDRALELEPDNLEALAGTGRAALELFKVSEAQAIYDRIAAVDSKAGGAYVGDMRAWLDATRSRLGPEMADAVSALDAWISEREKK